MIEKEIAELRRQLKPERAAITKIHGCYVNVNREIISTFTQSPGLLTEEENTMYMSLLKKVLSGRLGKNLIDLEFSTEEVAHGETHKTLMELKNTKLEDGVLLQTFYQKIIDVLDMEDNYLILLAHNVYDVPFRSRDGEDQPDASGEMFSHILCAICPVKQGKSGLGYDHEAKEFHTSAGDWLALPPVTGFLFPAFDHRSTNLYNALYYTKSALMDSAFIETIFHADVPMSAPHQKEAFEDVLTVLEDECSLEVVQTVTDHLREMMAAHKEAKLAEPLVVSRRDIEEILEDCDISEEHMADFADQFDHAFGAETALQPANLVEAKNYEVKTASVTIKAAGDANAIQTREIDGVKYILIRVDEDVTVNGVPISIKAAEEAPAEV